MPAVQLWRWEDPVAILRAALARGAVLAIPTESSYGLAADPRRRRSVAAVFRLKRRPAGEPLPVLAGDIAQLESLGVDLSHPALRRLIGAWPAALSVVAPLGRALPAAAGGRTLAVRVPAHPRLRRLLLQLGSAVTATSANLSGHPPALDPAAAAELMAGEDAVVIDDGVLPGGPPSTLVALAGDRLTVLRRGRYPMAELRRLAGELVISEPISADSVEMSADRDLPAAPSSRPPRNA